MNQTMGENKMEKTKQKLSRLISRLTLSTTSRHDFRPAQTSALFTLMAIILEDGERIKGPPATPVLVLLPFTIHSKL